MEYVHIRYIQNEKLRYKMLYISAKQCQLLILSVIVVVRMKIQSNQYIKTNQYLQNRAKHFLLFRLQIPSFDCTKVVILSASKSGRGQIVTLFITRVKENGSPVPTQKLSRSKNITKKGARVPNSKPMYNDSLIYHSQISYISCQIFKCD